MTCSLVLVAATSVAIIAADAPRQRHWAFVPPIRPEPPPVTHPELVRNELDHFAEAALERQGLTLGSEAGRETLIRRLSMDLLGLPPTPREIDAFLADDAPGAYERLLDRLLASPEYGARWGRHWLDAAGYADSNGYFSADSDRPLAYKYRDYVVRSLNADKPLDRFITEQLAGDELLGYEPDGDVTPDMVELLTATHFLRNSQDGTGESDGNPIEVLIDKISVIEGSVQILGASFLGLTVQCAKCHDHKFDPISQAEYYSLQAILTPAYATGKWRKPAERVVEVGTRAEREAHRQATEKADREIKAWRASLESAAEPLRKLLLDERLAPLSEAERAALEKARETAKEKRTDADKQLLKKHAKLIDVSEDDLASRFTEFAAVRSSAKAAIDRLERSKPQPLEQISVLVDLDPDPPAHHVFLRGSVTDPGPEAMPGVPAALVTPSNTYALEARARPGGSSGRRLALAKWLVSSENPVVARVLVNRIWQQHFGAGIVSTPDNFGTTGARPTHPELLDFLATEIVRRGWSLKAFHRLILGSALYRQSSAPRAPAMAVDPENRLLWKFPARRLESESIRDSMLAVSSELDQRIGGPYVPTQQAADGQFIVDEAKPGAHRRSIYLQARRTQPVALLEVFDSPLIVTSCTRRGVSTTPLQSLALLNSSFAVARAKALAARIESEASSDPAARIDLAFRLALCRLPNPGERSSALEFLDAQAAEYASDPKSGRRALEDFAQMLLASNGFLFVD